MSGDVGGHVLTELIPRDHRSVKMDVSIRDSRDIPYSGPMRY